MSWRIQSYDNLVQQTLRALDHDLMQFDMIKHDRSNSQVAHALVRNFRSFTGMYADQLTLNDLQRHLCIIIVSRKDYWGARGQDIDAREALCSDFQDFCIGHGHTYAARWNTIGDTEREAYRKNMQVFVQLMSNLHTEHSAQTTVTVDHGTLTHSLTRSREVDKVDMVQ